MEHFACGAMCHLKTDDDYVCDKSDFKVQMYTHDDCNSKVSGELKGKPTVQVSISDLFSRAWKKPYCLRNNNCIDYAIRCWNELEPIANDKLKPIRIKYEHVYKAESR